MVVRVLVAIGVIVVVRVGVEIGDELDASVLHTPRGEEPVRNVFELSRATTHDDHLEAAVIVEMNMERGADLLAEAMLNLGEVLAEVPHVMIVDQGDGGDGLRPTRDLRANDLAADEIAQDLGAGRSSCVGDGVEGSEERALHGHAEPGKRILTHERNCTRGLPRGQARKRRSSCHVLADSCYPYTLLGSAARPQA